MRHRDITEKSILLGYHRWRVSYDITDDVWHQDIPGDVFYQDIIDRMCHITDDVFHYHWWHVSLGYQPPSLSRRSNYCQ